MCVFNKKEGITYHLEPDHIDFLILPSSGFFRKKDNSKIFVARHASDSAMPFLMPCETKKEGFSKLINLLNDGYHLRVRCHAYHSFSGLGKSFEKIF